MQPAVTGLDTKCRVGNLDRVLAADLVSRGLFVNFRMSRDRFFNLALPFGDFAVVVLKDRQDPELVMFGGSFTFLCGLPGQRLERQA